MGVRASKSAKAMGGYCNLAKSVSVCERESTIEIKRARERNQRNKEKTREEPEK